MDFDIALDWRFLEWTIVTLRTLVRMSLQPLEFAIDEAFDDLVWMLPWLC